MQATNSANISQKASLVERRVRLEELSHDFAKSHSVENTPRKKNYRLLKHLHNWQNTLQQAYQRFRETPSKDLPFSRASEWMLDNFYLVKQTLHQIEEALPKSYYNELPKLAGTDLKGYPRVFALAWELVSYCQNELDLAQITLFVQNYQQVEPLTIGETWALPTMLRIATLESLAATVATITGGAEPESLNAARLLPAPPRPSSNETIVANCFNSLRLLAAADWKDFFEETSLVEALLRNDPADVYAHMDFATRNTYRSVVEELARNSKQTELAVAQAAIDLAGSADDGRHGKLAHIGYYLIDIGRRQLEKRIGCRHVPREWAQAHPVVAYLGSITLFTVLILAGLLYYAYSAGGSLLQMLIVGVLGSGLAAEVAIGLVHWDVTHRVAPRPLPRMDFTERIAAGNRSMVVIPALLGNANEVDGLLQDLELHHLSNPDPQLTFALLSDFVDAPQQHMDADEPLLLRAKAGVEALNRKYHKTTPFYLFHRERKWNPSQGVWMGWERKRGKLSEFNRLILDGGETSYTTQLGELGILHKIKYVITLDADTSLPQGSANRLVATLAHPLNQAEFATPSGRVISSGYTVLQPRVEIKPTSANRSRFSHAFSGDIGFDLYTLAVSDVYQDLFAEGSYVGKGIYDVAAFERCLAGQVRDNALLSHDLFEGIYGRAGLVTDVILYEEYPSTYLVYARRLRRWIRGDWQLLPWLFPLVPTQIGLVANPISLINRWKIFDNLRRSLLAPTILLLLIAGWLALPGPALIWTLLVLLPPTLPILLQAGQHVRHNLGRQSLKKLLEPSRAPLVRWGLSLVFLPYESFLALGAVTVTLTRLLITRKHMLQWTTAAHTARLLHVDARNEVQAEITVSRAFTALAGITVAIFHPQALWVALPLLAAWLASPALANWISEPLPNRQAAAPLTKSQRKQLQRLARRTWAFFEQFAGPDDHWLPPDHFQESPRGNTAHYTTPTNTGLLLVSTLGAYDLGYIGLFELAVRLRSVFENMERLEHYRGHLLNWYDTQTMTPLAPRYVSTVDSGNLAACLITLKQACLALKDRPVIRPAQWQGLLVILDILSSTLIAMEGADLDLDVEPFAVELHNISERISAAQDHPEQWTATLTWLSGEGWESVSRRLLQILEKHPAHLSSEILTELQLYLDTLRHHLSGMQQNIQILAPWLDLINQQPGLFTRVSQPLAGSWQKFKESVPAGMPQLKDAAAIYSQIGLALDELQAGLQSGPAMSDEEHEASHWCDKLKGQLASARMTTETLLIGYDDLAAQANDMVDNMDFRFLFDDQRQVFHLGYNVSTEKIDGSHYDLLASEARIASLIAIAKGDVPQSHWQHLGRPVTKINGRQALLSWSGTMFEYLMPALFTRNYPGTFLSDSCYAAVDAQIGYAQKHHVPWGISESGYYAFDGNMNYQYRAFGVPDLGYKRDLPDDLVVTPYASLLALSFQPGKVLENIDHLEELNMYGRFGLYEAVDFTKTRVPVGQSHAQVRSYMAHHQGMILMAACNCLLDEVMIARFHADERIHSVDLLLQEKIPQNANIEYPHPDEPTELHPRTRPVSVGPWQVPAASPAPQVNFLSQRRYGVMITNSGGGYSQWQDIALTRWQADTTLDQSGSWIYVQDLESGALWSNTCQPLGCAAESQEILFYPHKVDFRRWDHGISLHTEITVGADDVEVRRVTVLNDSDHPRRLRLTSYAEVVLATQETDQRHPAFNKLFIESEYLTDGNALLFNRRPRSAGEEPVFLAHAVVVEPGRKLTRAHESDRARFLGRGRTVAQPAALLGPKRELSGTVGETLDPIMSLAQEIELRPHSRAQVSFLTIAAGSRTEVLDLLARYQSTLMISRVFEEARERSEKELGELGLESPAVQHIQQLLSALLYPSGTLRAPAQILAKNEKGQSGLWAYGISGDYPILLVRIHQGDNSLVLEALQAYLYWRNRQIKINLVILNEQDTGYSLELHNQIHRQITRMGADAWMRQRDGIFLLRTDQIPRADRVLLETVAAAILNDKKGTLADHTNRLGSQPIQLPAFTPALPAQDPEPTPASPPPVGLVMSSAPGGFSPDGKEYVIHLQPGEHTPRPWINVIANPQFGFLVSEAGLGGTWAGNSGQNRLTPWRNDPVTDMPSEAIYLRDEETGLVWSPTPMPVGAESACTIRHGAGYSIFESQSHGLQQQLRLFAAIDAPVKIIQLRLQNTWARPRRLTITYYTEWVLGSLREASQGYIVPEFEPGKNALFATNRYNSDFRERVAFVAGNKKLHGVTADRTEFLGRNGSLRTPAALTRIGLASVVKPGLDPCAAVQLHVDLAPGQSEQVFFLLGQGAGRAESLELIGAYLVPGQVESAWKAVQEYWDGILDTITVQTPDPGMNLMLNRWLLYQTLACRVWGRTALYQSSGAFGFRDQLQDVLALLQVRPELAREHILEAARHQFDAGDVLHWWHPPVGRGVRTRFSDDLLWLPYVTAEYVATTGDISILKEEIPFLRGAELDAQETERYHQYESTVERYNLFEHCRRALEKGSTAGIHGLPLMGTGDWNDGMNRVGAQGRGESVWLGWFLHTTLTRFAKLCRSTGANPAPYMQQAADLAQALESHAWDGEWYLRAFYDDGTPLGSKRDKECQIDAIAQSWAVLSGAAEPHHAAQAMEAVDRLLVNEADRLIMLLTPPFDTTVRDPGYIKGYPPGIRENGGQYTHAAIWTAWAFAALGQGGRAVRLFHLLNPIYHADTPENIARYGVEPYVVAADIYSAAPHTGAGGWTWYTGSAGWMYRLGIEAILGLRRAGETLVIDPCIPKVWPDFKATYRHGAARYLISVDNPEHVNRGVEQVLLDGKLLPANVLRLADDGLSHEVNVVMGPEGMLGTRHEPPADGNMA